MSRGIGDHLPSFIDDSPRIGRVSRKRRGSPPDTSRPEELWTNQIIELIMPIIHIGIINVASIPSREDTLSETKHPSQKRPNQGHLWPAAYVFGFFLTAGLLLWLAL